MKTVFALILSFSVGYGQYGIYPYSSSIATTTNLSSGSIPYIGSGGALRQSNAQIFWDSTNARLGIGTASPLNFKMHVSGTAFVSAGFTLGDWLYCSKIYPYSSSDHFYIETNTAKDVYFKPGGAESVRLPGAGGVRILPTATPAAPATGITLYVVSGGSNPDTLRSIDHLGNIKQLMP